MKTQLPQFVSRQRFRYVTICLALLASISLTFEGVAQQGVSKEEYEKRQQGLIEAIAAMEAEQARQLASKKALDDAKEKNRPLNAKMEQALEENQGQASESATVTKAKSEIAAREARIRKGAPAVVAAALAPPGAPSGGVPVEGNGPAPGAKPVPQAEREKSRQSGGRTKEVEILAQGGSTFDSKANLVVFEQDVIVNHPQFDLVCDKLIVFLKKQEKEDDSALDKAVATGKRVTVRKVGADGEVQIGQARKVTFEGKTGDVILEIWPQVQTDTRLIQAKSQETIIILNQDGKMKINGPSITKLLLPEKKDASGAAAGQ
ncbi:MAG: LptA/OstA family protein [Verrucomicrobiales bacterium]